MVGAQHAAPDAVPNDNSPAYADVPGFCYSATLEEIRAQGYILTPGRYVGTEELNSDKETFCDQFVSLKENLRNEFLLGHELEQKIQKLLEKISYE